MGEGKMFDSPLSRAHAHAHIMVPEHSNGTADTNKVKITPTYATNQIFALLVQNTHASQILYISFDESTNWFTITAGKSLSISANINHFWIKANGAGTTYEIIMGLEPTTNEYLP